jgi:hypothetical protein
MIQCMAITKEERRRRNREFMQRWRTDHPEEYRKYWADYYEKNRRRIIEKRSNDPIYKERARLKMREWCKNHPQDVKERRKRANRKLREEVFNKYGLTCVCCGANDIDVLEIDHINGNGSIHRVEVLGFKCAGSPFYRWLKKNNFPEGFQTLCVSCNRSKSNKGKCRIDHLRK